MSGAKARRPKTRGTFIGPFIFHHVSGFLKHLMREKYIEVRDRHPAWFQTDMPCRPVAILLPDTDESAKSRPRRHRWHRRQVAHMTSRIYSRDSHILADAVIDPLAPDTCGGDACRSCRGGLGAGCQGLGHRHGGFEGAPLVDGAWLLVPWTVKAEFVGTVDRENLANTQEPEGEIEQARSSDELARPLLQRDSAWPSVGFFEPPLLQHRDCSAW